jgi:DNA (cytosine-5)-methyltransferase 1
MNIKTFGTMFSGGEGAGVGLRAAGLHHVWGIEFDADIAAVAADNGFAVHVADVRQVDYAALPAVDWLHASPVCTRASVANSGATEAQEDIDTAAAVVRALKAQSPQVFTLENVWQYRTFKAFTTITDALGQMGYFWTYDHCNSADFAVPQTRKRLILRASRGLLPWLPEPVPWVGWYAAIEDLLPTLPESKLAPWQLARLPDELRDSVLFSSNGNAESYGDHHADASDPALSVTAQALGRARAVLIAKTADKFGDGRREWSEQAQTIGANEHGSKAVLVAGLLNSESTTLTQRDGDEPAFTVTTSHNQRDARAWTGARVVSMTPRCLARFQSVPDDYRLPTKRTLAARVVGNMVPPLLMQRIAEGFLT